MVKKQIGKRIQYLRKKKGLTQEQLSEMVDISTNHLSAIERGVHNIKQKTLVKIMLCLECTADDVFADVITRNHLIKEYGMTEQINNLTAEEMDLIYSLIEEFDKRKRSNSNE